MTKALSVPPANSRTQHPRTQRADTVLGHCQSTSGSPHTAGCSKHRTQRFVRHLRGGSDVVLGLPEARRCIARTSANRP
eukprot:9197527-Alexandrium_andersonii.AAC.1